VEADDEELRVLETGRELRLQNGRYVVVCRYDARMDKELLEVDVSHEKHHVFVAVDVDMADAGLVYAVVTDVMTKLGFHVFHGTETETVPPVGAWTLTVGARS
jgi:hypothetical protein